MSGQKHLKWVGDFSYPGMVRKNTIADGSCFFHAIFKAYHVPYIEGVINDTPFDRKDFVQKFRKELSVRLTEKSSDEPSKTNYETLSRGEWPGMSKDNDIYSLKKFL